MNDYFDNYCSRDKTKLGSPSPYPIFEYSKGLGEPEQAPGFLPESTTSLTSVGVSIENAYGNRGNYLISSPAVIKGDPTGYDLFDSKQAIIDQLMHHMSVVGKDRDKTKNENLCWIESDILKCRNLLLELEPIYLGQNKGVDQRRLSIEQRLFDLYREKRGEEASCWRDQLWLKRDLIAALKEYLDVQRRKNLVNEIMEGDYSTNQNHH
jgi:hypothetical protein